MKTKNKPKAPPNLPPLANAQDKPGEEFFTHLKVLPFQKVEPLTLLFWRAGEGLQLGFIAQEIEKIYPEVVMTDKEGYKSVDYSRLTPVLVEAIKELKAEKDNVELRIKN